MSADGVPDLRGGALRAWVSTAGPIIAALGMLGGFVWQASRYPTRDEFDTLRASVIRIQVDQAVAATLATGAAKQADRIEKKVDELAQQGRKQIGR